MTHDDPRHYLSLAVFSLIFLVLMVCVVMTAFGFAHAFAGHVHTQVEEQLSAIATLRSEELSDWRSERLSAEAEILHKNTHFAEDVQRFIADPRDLTAQQQVRATLQSYRARQEYPQVHLLDRTGQIKLADYGAESSLAPAVAARIPDVLRTRQVTLVDFYHGDSDQRSALSILIPIANPQSGGEVIGLVALQIDPEVYIYPYLHRWPVPSASAETVLARREGDTLVALNPLRGDPQAMLLAQHPLTAPSPATLPSTPGQTVVITGRDYRGEPIVAVVQAVPDSPWLLITKIDTAEAYAPLWERQWQLAVFSSVLIVALGAGLLLLWRQQRLRAMHQQLMMAVVLGESERRFTTIFHSSPVGIIITRLRDNCMEDVNAAALRMFGYTREELVGRTALNLGMWTEPRDRQRLLEALHSQHQIHGFEASFYRRSGERRIMLVSAERIELNGEPSMLFQIMDITARKQAELALRASEEQYRGLIESLDSSVATVDETGTFLYINNVGARLLGLPVEAVIGTTMAELFPEHVVAAQLPHIQRAIRADAAVAYEALDVIQGQPRWYRISVQPIHDETGRAVAALINATDIHDLKTAQQTLQDLNQTLEERVVQRTAEVFESEAQNRLLFDESPDALVLFNMSGAVARMNHAFARMTGYDDTQLAGQPLEARGLLSSHDHAQLSGALEQARQSNSSAATEFQLTSAAGETHEVGARIFGLPIHGVQHYLAALRDITTEKQAAAALRQANAELARAARIKNEFLATMSHELRTPLNAILGLSESLIEELQSPLTRRQQAVLRSVAASGHHLLVLINDILDLSKIESGHLNLQIETVAIDEVCKSSMRFVREAAQKKALRMTLDMPDDLTMVRADPRRLKQMLANLLSNAIKFTPEGGMVRLEVTADAESGVVRLAVADTGIGIASENQGRLFQPFSQLDPALNREYEGTGLGLALVRRLAELHNGSVSVESALGQGSRFTIALPHRDVGQAPPAPASNESHTL